MTVTPPHGFTTRTRLGLTLIAGGAVANIYYNQPLLALLVAEFGERAALVVPTASLVGYGVGILGLVPLGDALPRRNLIIGQLLGLAVALLVAAWSPNLVVLGCASLAIGILASAAQQAVPFAAELAPDATRGRMVGQVMTGLFCGILLARTVSGFVGAHFGWRSVFVAAAVVSVMMAGIAAATLPGTARQRLRYRALMTSLLHILRSQPVLRMPACPRDCSSRVSMRSGRRWRCSSRPHPSISRPPGPACSALSAWLERSSHLCPAATATGAEHVPW